MIENVRGILNAVFEDYRQQLKTRLEKMGYRADWHLLNASDFGVPQLRPRVVIVALRKNIADHFVWPTGTGCKPQTVAKPCTASWPGAAGKALVRGRSCRRYCADDCRRLAETRRSRPWPTRASRPGRPSGLTAWHRRRAPARTFGRHAPPHRADGRPAPRLPGQLDILRPQDGLLSSSGQCLPAPGGAGRCGEDSSLPHRTAFRTHLKVAG